MVSMIWRTICDKSFGVIYWIESSLSWVLSNGSVIISNDQSQNSVERSLDGHLLNPPVLPVWCPGLAGGTPGRATVRQCSWGRSHLGPHLDSQDTQSPGVNWSLERKDRITSTDRQKRNDGNKHVLKNECLIWENWVVGLGILIN